MLDVEIEEIAVIRMQRGPVNALSPDLVAALEDTIDRIESSAAKAIVLTSGLDVFCAGADLGVVEAAMRDKRAGRTRMVGFVRRLQALLGRIEAHHLPSVAAIRGAATGGGLELALACDLRVAAPATKLGLPETGIGLLPSAGGTQRLTRIAGAGVARRIVLTGELVTGAEAHALGIVEYTDDDPDARAIALATRLAGLVPEAIAWSKRCIATAGTAGGFEHELTGLEALLSNPASEALVGQFLSRRTK